MQLKLIYLLPILVWGCSWQNKTDRNTAIRKDSISNIGGDSVVFKQSDTPPLKIFSFNEQGVLKWDSVDFQLELNPEKDGKVGLRVNSNGIVPFYLNGGVGVSKVFIQPEERWAFVTIFDFMSEDGANTGYPFGYNWYDDSRRTSITVYKNTCNPVYYKGNYYMVDNLNLIKTDETFSPLKTIPITYRAKDGSMDYLDTYRIDALGVANNNLQISFSPEKTNIPQKTYSGILTESAKKIILSE